MKLLLFSTVIPYRINTNAWPPTPSLFKNLKKFHQLKLFRRWLTKILKEIIKEKKKISHSQQVSNHFIQYIYLCCIYFFFDWRSQQNAIVFFFFFFLQSQLNLVPLFLQWKILGKLNLGDQISQSFSFHRIMTSLSY